MDITLLQKALKNSPVSEIRVFDEIDSTNDEALRWLEKGAPDFALVIADSQTKGRGRMNRRWITQPGTALAFSVILHPGASEASSSSSLYAPLCGLAVWQVLQEKYHLHPQIKWPNDILLERQKCCGILVEASWLGSNLKGIVLGIGINIKQESIPQNSETQFPATWLEKYTRHPVERFLLLADVLESLYDWRKKIGSREFFKVWNENLAFLGEEVRVERIKDDPACGIVEGINEQGNLLIKEKTGAIITIEAGDVHLRLAADDRRENRRF